MSSPRSSGKNYQNISLRDNSRGHFGDNYYASEKSPEELLLASLEFEGMDHYHHRPLETFEGTYKWIFDDNPTTFKTWLQSSVATDNLFWIHGKAGSGKSCLMKYILEHPQTKELLSQWAGTDVTVAGFFFWAAGSKLEKSFEGLLRSLLHQILQASPRLMKACIPQRYSSHQSHPKAKHHWTRSELLSALNGVAKADQTGSHFCFFIDGLDELESYSHNFFDNLRTLQQNGHVKICFSSRRWNVFRQIFDNMPNREFQLNELTQSDIFTYVDNELRADTRVLQLCESDASFRFLVEDVHRNAEGVFLWVHLAVEELKRGLGEYDDIATLQERLDAMPKELDGFLRQILANIDPVYKERTTRLLIWLLGARDQGYSSRLPLLWISFMEDDMKDPDFALKAPIQPMDHSELVRRIESASTKVLKWCKDLVHVIDWRKDPDIVPCFETECRISGSPFSVGFSHRTVADFVQQMYDAGELHAGGGFDSERTTRRMYVRMMKSYSDSEEYEECEECVDDFAEFLDQVMNAKGSWEPALLRALDTATATIMERLPLDRLERNYGEGHWSKRLPGVGYELDFLSPEFEGQDSFASLALSLGNFDMFWQLVNLGPLMNTKQTWSFWLECVIMPVYDTSRGLCSTSFPDVKTAIQLLNLEEVDVNTPVTRRCSTAYSVWQRFLLELAYKGCWASTADAKWAEEIDMLHHFLHHGADPEARLKVADLGQPSSHHAGLGLPAQAHMVSQHDGDQSPRDCSAQNERDTPSAAFETLQQNHERSEDQMITAQALFMHSTLVPPLDPDNAEWGTDSIYWSGDNVSLKDLESNKKYFEQIGEILKAASHPSAPAPEHSADHQPSEQQTGLNETSDGDEDENELRSTIEPPANALASDRDRLLHENGRSEQRQTDKKRSGIHEKLCGCRFCS